MSTHDVRSGITITVEGTDVSFHSYKDWDLYVANNNPIGDPVQYRNYITIPGRSGKIDLSEVLAGRPVYESRPLKIWLAGLRSIDAWNEVISNFRNRIEGRICRIIFDTDPGYYWVGRVGIIDFKPVHEFGKFCIDIPDADPYKYSIESSTEPWKWDPFNFINGVITYVGSITVDGTRTVVIPYGHMPTSPEFVVSNKTGTLTVTCNGVSHELSAGNNKVPSIIVGGDNATELIFAGKARIEIVYRSGSL